MYFVYVLRSTVSEFYYTGHTQNLRIRIAQHNSGKTRSTKAYVPLELVYFEVLKTRTEAISRERYLKSGVGREFLRKTKAIKNARVVQLDRIPDFGSGG